MQTRWVIAASLALVACGGLPRTLRDEIRAEHDRLAQADRQLQRTSDNIRDEAAQNAAFFTGTTAVADWQSRLQTARGKIDHARADDVQLAAIKGGGNAERRRATDLVARERALRLDALHDSETIDADAAKWLDYRNNAPHYLAKLQGEYESVRNADLTKVSAAVAKAETDWPEKKTDLEGRLTALRNQAADAEKQWKDTDAVRKEAAAGSPAGPSVATLIQADDALARESDALTRGTNDLTALPAQLYDSWDKVLVDLDRRSEGPDSVYREKVKTVRTHYVDPAAKKTTISSDEQWTDVPAGTYRSVENDLGMTIAHKDAGLYDAEAQSVAQPPGFAYIATPEQGSNRYGYWTHTSEGSFWTFLPEYLILRDLLWGPSYRPVYVNEFSGYYTAQRMGRTYYGNETPAAPPKYGSHGTFTQQRYAGSRYVQSGGFKGSAYSSGGGAATRPAPGGRPMPGASPSLPSSRPGTEPGEMSGGKRFGGRPSGGGSSPPIPSGKRFGGGGGFGGGSRPSGKGFGGRRR